MSFPCLSARHELKKRSVPRDPNVREEKRFFPSCIVDKFLDKTAVETILDCPCDRCKGHLSDLGKQDPPIRYATKIVGTNRRTDAKALFALLIYIEHPMFIVAFMERGMDSKSLESFCAQPRFEPRSLEDYWPRYHQLNPIDSSQLAQKFSFSMHQFAPPILDHSNFSVYSAETIFPFIEGPTLGSGSYGEVYPFSIYEGYNQIPGAENIKYFARKQLRHKTPAMEFASEKASLSTVDRLKDNHIVKFIKTYKKGDEYNIIFPCAKSNLHKGLRDPTLDLTALCEGPLQNRKIWHQMLGLAKALNRISYYDAAPDENPENLSLGYHFDLKPANILITEDNVFQITDFGQAKFKANDGNSKVTHDGGTEDYAAPEFESGQEGSKYDVWSLGCIFAEIFTFVLRSYAGVIEFGEKRAKCFDPRRKIKRYYDEVSGSDRQPSQQILKPAVRTWLESLPQSEVGISAEDLAFLKSIQEIIINMLVVNIDQRWTSTKVYQQLETLLDKVSTFDFNTQINPPVGASPGTVEIGGEELRNTRSLFARSVDFGLPRFIPAVVQINEIPKRLLITTRVGGSTYCSEVLRDGTLFVPQYAMRKDHRHIPMSDWDFRFVSYNVPDCGVGGFDYKASDFEEARLLQGTLTGHRIIKSFQIKDINYSEHLSTGRQTKEISKQVLQGIRDKVMRVKEKSSASSTHAQQLLAGEEGPFTLQIWQEAPRMVEVASPVSPVASSNSGSIRDPRETQAPVEASTYRIVVFYSRQFLVIPFAEAWRLNKYEPEPTPLSASLVPTRPRLQGYLIGSLFRSNLDNCLPGIPFDRARFREAEATYRMDFDSVVLGFRSPRELETFKGIYWRLKDDWLKEHDALGIT